jgi:hypothetical protein
MDGYKLFENPTIQLISPIHKEENKFFFTGSLIMSKE